MAKEYMQINLTFDELKLIHTMLMMLSMMERKFTTRTARSLNNKVITALQELDKNDRYVNFHNRVFTRYII